MRKTSAIIAILLASVGVGLVYRLVRDAGAGGNGIQESRSPEQVLATKTDTQNDVEVQVTPKIIPEQKAVDFEVSLTTHSVDLNQDMVAASTLVDQTGKVYKPASWDGTPPGGHHRSGTLRFEGAVKLETMMLKIEDPVGETVFEWEL